jgi:hypothetical protein
MSDTPKSTDAEDLIRYDILAQEALRGVVKKVLQEVARTGLPGEHHFYITFDTQYSGVRMSSRMREKYPEEMTVVIQHQFWDLESNDQGFSIGLSFDNIPETLSVPFASVRGFFDPSVQFGLQFEATDDVENQDHDEESAGKDSGLGALPSPPKLSEITDESDAGDTDQELEETSADVVSLDAFRKK